MPYTLQYRIRVFLHIPVAVLQETIIIVSYFAVVLVFNQSIFKYGVFVLTYHIVVLSYIIEGAAPFEALLSGVPLLVGFNRSVKKLSKHNRGMGGGGYFWNSSQVLM